MIPVHQMYELIKRDTRSTAVVLVLITASVSTLAGFGLWDWAWLVLGLAAFVGVTGALHIIGQVILIGSNWKRGS